MEKVKRFLISILLICFGAVVIFAQERVEIKYGPYLQNLKETETTIVWVSNKPSIGWVELAPDDGSNFYQKERSRYFDSKNGVKNTSLIHSVKISDLKPGTTYRYRVYSQEILDHQGVEVIYGRIAATDVWSKKPLCFTTNDRDKKEISFTVLNDIHGRTNDISELLNAVNYEENDMVILGNREEDQLKAIELNVSCIIVGMSIQVSEKVIKKAEERQIIIISSPYDTYTIARMINQSIPVNYVMKKDNLVTFNTEDFTDDIQDVMIKHRHRAFPVINKRGKCVGTISRRNFLDMHKKQVILVDHNEKDQAVDNIEKAEILEIIDHHKLGSLETMKPINFRNEPVGCTATILYRIYDEQRLEIPPKIAGLLCAAIISDTLMFRSPTCTQQDKIAASALALIADIKIEDFAREMFKAGSNLKDKAPEEIFYQDYKKFIAEGNVAFGVGQISSMDEEELQEIKVRLKPFMVSECGRHGITRVYFMLTNIMDESSDVIYYGEGSEEMGKIAFQQEPEDKCFHLKGVVSRKKQMIPAMMEAAQIMANDFN